MSKQQNIKPISPIKKSEIETCNKARRLMDLPLIQIKVRCCNVCRGLFESYGNRNCGCQSSASFSIQGREIL